MVVTDGGVGGDGLFGELELLQRATTSAAITTVENRKIRIRSRM
jgi:hypothetical protein